MVLWNLVWDVWLSRLLIDFRCLYAYLLSKVQVSTSYRSIWGANICKLVWIAFCCPLFETLCPLCPLRTEHGMLLSVTAGNCQQAEALNLLWSSILHKWNHLRLGRFLGPRRFFGCKSYPIRCDGTSLQEKRSQLHLCNSDKEWHVIVLNQKTIGIELW